MQTNLNVMVNGNNLGLQAMAYKYDQLNRIKETQAWAYEKNAQTNVMAWTAQGKRYKEGFSYDGNGNIVSLLRYAQAGGTNPIDNLEYGYNYHNNDPTKLINNQLKSIKDLSNSDEGLKSKGQVEQGFSYDAIGNLLSDAEGEVTDIKWTVYGKIEEVKKADNKTIKYRYDGTGNRSAKMFYEANVLKKTTYYFRDASGNVMGIYEQTEQTLSTGEGGVKLIEQPIYGSSRIGTYNGKSTQFKMTLGNKQYELSNHLSNTLITLSDNKIGVDAGTDNTADYYEARVLSATDYYAFGMAMKERSWQSETYRYGFNGKENDTDWEVQDYGFRIYKPEISKFLSVDPLSASYPWNSVYAFAENSPIYNLDLDGGEKLPYSISRDYRAIYDNQTFTLVLIQPTADEIKTITNAKGIYYAGHGAPLYLRTSQKRALIETQISFGKSTFSACETGLYYPAKKGTQADYGSVEYQSWITKVTDPETTINLLILNTKQDAINAGIPYSDTDYYVRGNVGNNIIWNTDGEAEFASYTNGFKLNIDDYNGNNLGLGTGLVTVNEINTWKLSPEGRDAILLDQHDAYFPSNPMKSAYEAANSASGKATIISNVEQQLRKRDQSIGSPAGGRYFRLSAGGGTVVNEQQRKQKANQKVSVSAYGGVLPNH